MNADTYRQLADEFKQLAGDAPGLTAAESRHGDGIGYRLLPGNQTGADDWTTFERLADEAARLLGASGTEPWLAELFRQMESRTEYSGMNHATGAAMSTREIRNAAEASALLLRRMAAAEGEPPKPQANGKPSHSQRTEDERIAKEYYDGLEAGLWKGQAEYVRQKHPGRHPSWLSKLLKRVAASRN